MQKRNDAFLVKDIKTYNRIFPYLMKKRNESLVYHNFSADISGAVEYIEEKNRRANEKKYRIFDIIMASIVRTFALYPALNRFIAGHEFWQRKELSFNFVIKTNYTEDAPERNVLVTFEPDMAFEEIAAVMRHSINSARHDEETPEEAIIKKLFKLPKPLRIGVIKLFQVLDSIGRYPKILRDVDGMHASAGIANLGSLGISEPALHHLYNHGTSSMFITFGSMARKRQLADDGNSSYSNVIDFSVTMDERIAEGYYFMKALNTFKSILEDPSVLEKRLI
ncbi:MAG: 2-oxo acid dehydrogenase subunit E2, partial [Spirochaetia bacterium]|nr:2-oxo acid dehydrogenase subunit E2 [Spirochaetia bacterium]